MNLKKHLNIGIFTDVYYPSISGVVVAVDTLRKTLEKEGHKVYIITMNNDPKSHKYIKKGNVLMIPGIPIGIYDYSLNFLYPFKAVNYIKKLNLDIIHAHTEFGMGLLAKIMSKKLDIPLVHTYHTIYEESVDYVTKGWFPNTSKKILKTYMKSYFSKTVKEVITPTKKSKDFLKNTYHLKQNINIIPNGIDTEKFNIKNLKSSKLEKLRKTYNLNKDDFVITWVGRLGYEKRIDVLIEGFKIINQKYKNTKLLIVGGGPEEEKLKELSRNLNISDNVIFTGKTDYNDVPYYYNLSNVLASASHYETQGLTLMEAFSAKIPVVVVNDKSFTPIVKNGINGMIFKNKKEYANAVIYLIENKNVYNAMKENAYKLSYNYSLPCFAAKILYIYNKAISDYKEKNKV